jgi:hypothetical protein
LPYEVVGSADFPAPIREASLLPLHCHPSSTDYYCSETAQLSPSPLAGRQGHSDYRHEWTLELTRTELTPGGLQDVTFLDYKAWSAQVAGQRLSLTFAPLFPFLLPTDGAPTCGADTRAEIRVDSVLAESSTYHPETCAALKLSMRSHSPSPGSDVNASHSPVSAHSIVAGGIYVPVFAAISPGRTRVVAAAQDLVDAQTSQYPVVESDDGAFVDEPGGIQGELDGDEKYLAHHIEAQEALIGGLMQLANLWYQQALRESISELGGVHHQLEVPSPWVGLVSSQPGVSYILDTPFSSQGNKLLIDLKGVASTPMSREGFTLDVVNFPADARSHHWVLQGHQASALEHAVWEEIANLEAVSTVKASSFSSGSRTWT